MWYTCVSCRLGVPHVCYNLSCNIFDCFRLFLIIGIVTPKTLFICVLLYLWLPHYLISLFVLTSTAFLLWRLIPFPRFIASPLLFPLFYVTHPLYSCATNTDLYPLTPVSLLSRFLPLSYSFPCAPVSQFSLRPPFTVFLTAFLVPLSYSFPLFPCLTVFLVSLFLACIDPFSCYCQIRPQGYGGGQGEPVPDSIGDSPISPDTPTRPILGTEEVIEVARGE